MDDWLQQVSAVAQKRTSPVAPFDVRFKQRQEFLRCSGLVRDSLQKLAKTYWPNEPRRRLRVSLIPMKPVGQVGRLSRLWNRFRHHHGWRVQNATSKESFEIYLVWSSRGFCFELPSEYRTLDTSKEQLQDALCKAAIDGPVGYGDVDALDVL